MRKLQQFKTIDKIPYSEDAIWDFLKKELKQYQGNKYYCNSLGVYVLVTRKSIDETAYNARFNRKAALLACNLPYIIQHAKIQKLNLPTKSLKQSQRMRIQTIAILTCNVSKIGIAKLVIGIRDDGIAVIFSYIGILYSDMVVWVF